MKMNALVNQKGKKNTLILAETDHFLLSFLGGYRYKNR